MALSDGIKQYWQALIRKPQFLIFDYLAAQRAWQRNFAGFGHVKFHGRPDYIAFMQALMMDGVKGSALISFLGEVYQAGSSPSLMAKPGPVEATKDLVKEVGKKAIKSFWEYQAEVKDLENAQLNVMWRTVAPYSLRPVFEAMKNGEAISPSDLAG